MIKYVTLCADDYGQNPEISQAIVDLIDKKILTATSSITSSPYWLKESNSLIPFKDKIDLGLHFNLTEGPLLIIKQPFSLKKCILHSFLNQLDKTLIEAELNAQIDEFVAGVGQLPDFIDGHQHIHQLPVIRDILIKVYNKRLKSNQTYIRALVDDQFYSRFHSTAYFKESMIQMLGARPFKKLLLTHHIPHNVSFAGIYNFNASKKYPQFFACFLKQIADGGLIMCHPGRVNKNDQIAESRFDEYRFFLSNLFLEITKQSNVIMTRFKHKK